MNILKINGQALEGIYVDAAISFNKPAKRVSTYSVPGRNGDLVIDEGTFDNVLITYPVFEKNTFPAEFDEIVNKLAALEGYQRIECSNDPQHYRLGRFVVPQNPTAKRLNRDGYYQLSFDCKPQRWLLSGEEDTEIDANPIDEYSGDIVSFDAVALDEITELKVNIEPIQNLNGYDNPWPAGGGKNKLNVTLPIVLAAAGNIGNTPCVLPAGTYTFTSKTSVATAYSLSIYDSNGTQLASASSSSASSSDLSVTFTISATSAYIRCYYNAACSITNMQIESGSSFTGYAPYSNVCPISGHTEVNVTRTGVNVWDEEWEQGLFDGAGNPSSSTTNIRTKNNIPVQPNTTYYAHIGTSGANLNICFLDENGGFLSRTNYPNTTFTTPLNCRYIKFSTGYYNSGTYKNDISINYPSTDHDYHAYAGQPYSISLGQTVYGGTLNVGTGVLTVDMLNVDLGTLNWVADNTVPRFYTTGISSVAKPMPSASTVPNFVCSQYATVYFNALYQSDTDNVIGISAGAAISIKDKSKASLTGAAFKSAMSGVQLCYELATPTTVQLTPTQVSTLLGANNIWADTGDVEVKVTSPTVFNNPSLFNSKPLIRVYGVGTFRVNDITVTIASHDKPYIDIDCELQECFYEGENMNEYVSFSGNDFPELQPGDNYMLLASGITKLDVIPRWWVL